MFFLSPTSERWWGIFSGLGIATREEAAGRSHCEKPQMPNGQGKTMRTIDELDNVKISVNTKEKLLTIEDSEGKFVFKLIEGDENQLAELAGITLASIPYLDEGEDSEYQVYINGKYCPPS